MAQQQIPNARSPGNLALDEYVYSTGEPVNLAAGETKALSVKIEADADFEILKRLAFFTNATDPDVLSLNSGMPITVQMTDTGSGRDLFSSPVFLACAFGNAQYPFIMQQTKIFAARSVIALSVSNLSTIEVKNFQLVFEGRKIFRQRQYA